MRRAERQIRDLVRPLDPMHDAADPPSVGAARESAARESAARRRAPRARRAALAVAASLVLLVSGLMWTSAGPSAPESYAATPAPLKIVPPERSRSGAVTLHEIARRAAASNTPKMTSGRTGYIKMRNWYLNSQIDSSGTVSAIQPVVREFWRNADGSGRSVITRDTPRFRSERARKQWVSNPSVRRSIDRWAAGARDHFGQGRPPTDADALRRWLHQRSSGQPEPMRTLTAVTDLLRHRVLLPDERAALLRVLAELPGLHYDGTTHDRAGRPGLAFSLESDASGLPTRHTLVIDPDNGGVLGYEEMLTTSAGALNVRIPAVISYETYLAKKFVARR